MTILSGTLELIKRQLKDWPLAATNYAGLEKVRTRCFTLEGGSEIKVQFNPERIRSSAAKVDEKTINERPCFLCQKNRPSEQEGIDVGYYTILINPFPIFPEHLTIPHATHTLQKIAPFFSDMLDLAHELSDFTLFYNGPKCGASAPDHFHFQAGIKNFMPVEEDFRSKKYARLIGHQEGVNLYSWINYNRGVITIEGGDKLVVSGVFEVLHQQLWAEHPEEIEPMLNILAYFEQGNYVVHIFPRILHRPSCFFKEGKDQIMISPASVDMGGIFITPRLEDFKKITSNDIELILREVCMDEKKCLNLLSEYLRKTRGKQIYKTE